MQRRNFLKIVPVAGIAPYLAPLNSIAAVTAAKIVADRQYWINTLTKIADPVLNSLSTQTLKQVLPYEGKVPSRITITYLECFGRLLAGMAPWLELGPGMDAEGRLRAKYIGLIHKCVAAGVDPASPDYMDFTKKVSSQPLVDAAFLAHGLLRGYKQLWEPLDAKVKQQVVTALKITRDIKPGNSNWILFSAMVEALILKAEGDCDFTRIDYAINKHQEWYKGDGMYGDGPEFHYDYYNSFVIHPMLLDVVKIMVEKGKLQQDFYDKLLARAERYAAIQERLISPEGTFPVVGRSLAYRVGVFQLLGQISLQQKLPAIINPAQVRCALTAVMRRMMEAPGTFDQKNWLRVGFCGHQPDIGEEYIVTGSLYLCSVGFLPLGLPADNAFWAAPAADWTSKKAWSGVNMPVDHAINI